MLSCQEAERLELYLPEINNKQNNFIIKGFRTIVISTTFWPIYPPAFFRCLSNSGTYTELSFIESMGVASSDSVSYNRVQVLSLKNSF